MTYVNLLCLNFQLGLNCSLALIVQKQNFDIQKTCNIFKSQRNFNKAFNINLRPVFGNAADC